ncbi:MAG TPA: hypothetical protein ACFYEK_08400 [Candidatus Wunengus sp. YC60]|uniref:hypothetical protein n=1 Tax=Candidatus Wunengus sp. YC60 TaxID=3367697 RepID=UPI004024AA98
MNLKETIKNIQNIQQIEIPESLINSQCRDHSIDCEVALHNDYVVLRASSGLEAHLCYHSHELDHINGEFSFTMRVLKIKPLYYWMSLPLVNVKYPFLKYSRDSDNERLITCHIDKVPGIGKIMNTYRHNFGKVMVGAIAFQYEKVIIEMANHLQSFNTH